MRASLSAAAIVLTAFFGKPAMPGRIPGDRLIANLTVRLKKEPGSAALYYLIGRAHCATFSRAVENAWLKPGEIEVFGANDNPSFHSFRGNVYPWGSQTAVRDTPDNRRHVAEAVRNLRMALRWFRPRQLSNDGIQLSRQYTMC